MASSNEHRMVFDIRGRRRHVVKVVYAILAILMAASLFLVIGPFNIGELVGNGSSSIPAEEFEKHAERIEVELQKQPGEEKLLANLTNNRMLAGQQLYAVGPNGETAPTIESRTQYQKASAAWSEYLEASQEPSPSLSQRMGGVLFSLAQISRSFGEANQNLIAAAEAQKIYSEQRPTLNSLSTLALYTAFTDIPEAEKINAEAEKLATSKFQREQLSNQFKSTVKSAEAFQKELAAAEKASKEAAKNKGAEGAAASPEGGAGLGGVLGGSGLAE
jgi:hypothetical protein